MLRRMLAAIATVLLVAGCAQSPTMGESPTLGETEVRQGRITRIDSVSLEGDHQLGLGAIIGGIAGGVLGNQIGGGSGRGALTILGAFGGALVGNHIETNEAAANSRRYYHVVVEFAGGVTRSFDYSELNGLRVGMRVKLDRGVLDRA